MIAIPWSLYGRTDEGECQQGLAAGQRRGGAIEELGLQRGVPLLVLLSIQLPGACGVLEVLHTRHRPPSSVVAATDQVLHPLHATTVIIEFLASPSGHTAHWPQQQVLILGSGWAPFPPADVYATAVKAVDTHAAMHCVTRDWLCPQGKLPIHSRPGRSTRCRCRTWPSPAPRPCSPVEK